MEAKGVGARDGDPGGEGLRLLFAVFFILARRVWLRGRGRFRQALDVGDDGLDLDAVKPRERALLDDFEGSLEWLVAIGVEVSVARVVVPGVEVAQVLPREVGNGLGGAARDVGVREPRKRVR